ncbi:R3H domain protein (single-stranded nucleic acid binding protein) [Desulforapulum autotrophicum HRM2]|uniref:RNA-binding protein KhpB n=1 Tax=Desulforapulum autotrophicum (strain ATCC 43914 / DSM 3382 / VKM B-1955 / HRM2) TaxID=177437 RepID=C0QIZ0_DESAH|nr:RNA-binding cell elongation regulator Jag/EloR [Desulforapulum autotrophicum]ACN13780.1 R3H domain protein (single-stranded nucleic acid binding protein) [Desulforapulum autotrophicum HRM2]
MKQTQEFEGKNVEQAIENACKSLNVTKKKLSYDVISSGSSGIFGIVGVKKAKIRVSLPDKKGGSTGVGWDSFEGDDLEGVMSIVDEAFAETPAAPAEKPAEKPQQPPRKKPQKSRSVKAAPPEEEKGVQSLPEESDAVEAAPPAEEKVQPPKKEKARPQKARKPRAPKPATEDLPKINTETETDEPETEDNDFNEDFDEEIDDRDEGYPPKYKDEIPVDVSEASTALGVETLQRMVDLITTDSTVVATTDQDRLLLRVEGGNSGVLIGRRGQTLEAMQFLTDKIINRKSESRVRLKVDIEGYMETRKANLQSLAHKMADKAKKTGKPATINQMTAQDRRIVHIALKDDTRVRTQSMGDGYYRRLVIFPKKGTFKKRRPPRKQP